MKRSKSTRAGRTSGYPMEAPRAVPPERYTLLEVQDLVTALSLVGEEPPPQQMLDEIVEKLNEALSSYLWGAEPGTQDREGALRRQQWFTDVAETAVRLQQLLRPVDNAALLLSGIGQPMLWLRNGAVPRKTLSQWQDAVSSTADGMRALATTAEQGRASLARQLYDVRTEVSGWPTVLPTRRTGRPPERNWAALADELFESWQHTTGKSPTVTVNPMIDPPPHTSVAATFAARLLDVAAVRLPPEKSWAEEHLREREQKLVEHLEGRQRRRRPRRPKTEKPSG